MLEAVVSRLCLLEVVRSVLLRIGIELGSSGGMLRAWGRGGVEVCRYGGVEMRCRRVASKRYGDLGLGRHAAGLGTWRCLPQEVWRCAAGVQM